MPGCSGNGTIGPAHWEVGVGLLNRLKAALVDQVEPNAASSPRRPASRTVRTPVSTAGPMPPRPDPWVPFGQAVRLHGLTLYGGLLHVGEGMASLSGHGYGGSLPEPSLIRPTLTVDLAHPDDAGSGMRYWPSYSELSPQTRGGYLRWLAEGRNRSGGPIGFVFLYFYGLERRLLVDMHQAGAANDERPILRQEVGRLLRLYGENHSLRQYATGLLSASGPVGGPRRYDSAPPARMGWTWEMPFDVALALGQLVQDGRPIPAEWAQAWWQGHPDSRQRTAVQRCPQEFGQVFAALYAEQCGDGLVLKPNKRTLSWRYRPASPGLHTGIVVDAGVPDVRGLRGPLGTLAAIAEEATDSLGAYSRYVGRNPSRAGSPQAVALLPLRAQQAGDSSTVALLEWASAQVTEAREKRVRTVELVSRWGGGDRLLRADMDALASLLGRRGVGIEPDVRFGGPVPKRDSSVVLFRRADPALDAASTGYHSAMALLQLAGAVAAADGAVAETETRTLIGHVSAGLGLSDDENARLRAHLLWVMAHPPTPATLRKRVQALTPEQRDQAARLLVAVAAADGQISSVEVDVIARMFVVLGFEATEAYAQVHTLATAAGAPRRAPMRPVADPLAPARTAGEPAAGFVLPPRDAALDAPPTAKAGRPAPVFALDPEVLERTRRSSEQVAELLAGIFREDEQPVSAAAPVAAEPDDDDDDDSDEVAGPPLVPGLDAAHSALLRVLASSPPVEPRRPDRRVRRAPAAA